MIFDRLIVDALIFTLLEAGLSALFSTMAGVILARILMRRQFPMRAFIERLLLMPFFLPPLFVIIGLVSAFGAKGLGVDIFGMRGIILAHMVLNIPLAMHIVLGEWRAVPLANLNIARNLGAVHPLIERPLLMRAIPNAFALIFLYSALSFTIVLTLGGGPAHSTIEVALYQAIRFDFDLERALSLACLEAVLGVSLYMFLRKRQETHWPNSGLLGQIDPPPGRIWRIHDALVLIIIAGFLLTPLIAMLLRAPLGLAALEDTIGFAGQGGEGSALLLRAFLTSFLMAIIAAFGAQLLCLLLIRARMEAFAWLAGAISPMVLAIMAIWILRPLINPFDLGLGLVILIQIIVLQPLITRLWQREVSRIAIEEKRLALALMGRRRDRFRHFWLPRLAPGFLRISAIIFTLAFSDLALLPLFAPAGFTNLALLMWNLIASYRFEAGFGVGGILLLVSLFVLLGAFLAASRLEPGRERRGDWRAHEH